MKQIAVVIASLCLVPWARAQDLSSILPQYPRDYVVGPKVSYLIEPPTVLSPHFAGAFQWSADSRSLLFIQTVTPSGKRLADLVTGQSSVQLNDFRPEIVLYEIPSNRSRRIPMTLEGGLVSEAKFVGQTSTVIVTQLRLASGLPNCVSASFITVDGRTVTLDAELLKTPTTILTSSSLPEVYLASPVGENYGTTWSIRAVDLSGRVRPVGQITGPALTPSADGKSISTVVRAPGSNQATRRALDVTTGKVTESVATTSDFVQNDAGSTEANSAVLISETPNPAPGAGSTIRLVSADGDASADGEEGGILTRNGRALLVSLSPNSRYVVYATEGVTLLRGLQPLDAKLVEVVAERTAQSRAMKDAKAIATGFQMYAADYNDTFPSNAAGWQDNLNPYLRDRSITGKFVYAFKGGSVADIKNPSETVLGYIATKSGRAVAYADSSVKWVPNGK